MLLKDLEVGVVLINKCVSTECYDGSLSTRTSSLRQKAQIDFGLAALTGVPFACTAARVPAASAFFCSFLTRSFFVIGILVVEVGRFWAGSKVVLESELIGRRVARKSGNRLC